MDKTLQYRQIDYLRLFKLCREMGVVKSKRKLPIQCEQNYQKSLCKRLLGSLIKELFTDWAITNDDLHFYLSIPGSVGDTLAILLSKQRNYFDQNGEDGATALIKFNELKQIFSGHITMNLPSEIRVEMVSYDRSSKYNRLVGVRGPATKRPRESFFQAGKSIIEFKKVWEANVPFLLNFITTEEERRKQREEEQNRQKKERRQAERLRLEEEKVKLAKKEKEKTKLLEKEKEEKKLQKELEKMSVEVEKSIPKVEIKSKTEELKVLTEKLEKEKKSKQQQAQLAFNAALLKFNGEKNG